MAPHKEASAALEPVLICTMIIPSCLVHLAGMLANPLPGDFNLTKGTRWAYLFSAYDPLPTDPKQTT